MTSFIKEMSKAVNIARYITNASKLHQRSFSKCYKKNDDPKNIFAINLKLQQRSIQTWLSSSSAINIGTHQKVRNLGTNMQGVKNRFAPSFLFGGARYPARLQSSCSPTLMEPRGRVAVVTGATRGIGLAIVEELLCNGAKVFMIDVAKDIGECTASRLGSIYGWDNIQFAVGDVTCYEAFEACMNLAVCKFQRLDILVNNAGVLTACPREKIIDINYKSVIFGTRLGLKYMGSDQGKDGGVVINVASVVGLIGLPGSPVYSATKHAVIGASMSYGDCLTFDKTCVRVCTVCPGCTATEMTNLVGDLPVENFRDGAGERTLLKDALDSLPKQPCSRLGPATVHVIRYGPNGSVWVAEDSELYQVVIPDYHDVECCNTRIKNLE